MTPLQIEDMLIAIADAGDVSGLICRGTMRQQARKG